VLQLYAADLLVLPALSRVLVRDVSPLVIGIFAAGRVSVALAARLGGMRLRREIEALEGLGVDPARYVLSPALVAIVIAAPIHAFLASFTALLAAGFALKLQGQAAQAGYLTLAV